jgi:hypothetical protein
MKNKITTFDNNNLTGLRVEMDLALRAISNKYGITIKTGNASFSGNECTFKVKLNTTSTDGTVITKEAKTWDLYKGLTHGPLEGLKHLSVGDKITISGNTYILSGFNTRAKKAPINFTDLSGRGYKCSVRMLANENSK